MQPMDQEFQYNRGIPVQGNCCWPPSDCTGFNKSTMDPQAVQIEAPMKKEDF